MFVCIVLWATSPVMNLAIGWSKRWFEMSAVVRLECCEEVVLGVCVRVGRGCLVCV